MNSKQLPVVAVIGASSSTPEMEELAHKVGSIVANVGCILVCGGLEGVMKAVSKGAVEAGGVTIGLLPGLNKEDANEYIQIALPTTIGFARNAMVAASGDVVIALPGSHGTRSEISYALVYKRPIIDLGGWDVEGMIQLGSVDELADTLKNILSV